MVKYALKCETCDVGFDGWFSSSEDFDAKKSSGELLCLNCGSTQIEKQIMAPAVSGTRKNMISTSDQKKFAEMAKAVREHVSSTHEYVGDNFAETARSMYYGEKEAKPVWGQTSIKEAKELAEEGVPALPLPAPMVPEKPADPKKLN